MDLLHLLEGIGNDEQSNQSESGVTRWDALLARVSIEELEEILQERLSALRLQRRVLAALTTDMALSSPEDTLSRIFDVIRADTTGVMAPTPVVLYLDDETTYSSVHSALVGALESFGLEIAVATQTLEGSIWQAFVAALRRQVDGERLDQVGDLAVAGAKARWHGEPQSQITKAQGEAIASLLAALEGNQNALLAFSNILIVKVDGVPLVRELTPEQVEHLQRNPRLYTDPRLALGMLDDGRVVQGDVASGPGQQAIAP
ncbi:hypothetical protein [Nonomuraea sp. NPDC049141]|uniref:hypothetical protein n=1 Tax=Nonomuraea sp. NPDC049141 TaxID=3155500 RepID=UPI0033D20337